MAVYLSRLTLNLRSPAVRRDLADIQQLHRSVMRHFDPDQGNRARQQILYRLELPSSALPTLLIQSGTRPAWQLDDDYTRRPPESKDISDALEAITAGQQLRFRLRANPTRRPPAPDRSNPPRVPLTRWDTRLVWLNRKLETAGATAVDDTIDIASQPRDTGYNHGRRITVWPVLYHGLLQVGDPLELRRAIINGIGPARAYGNGLLSIAPASIRHP